MEQQEARVSPQPQLQPSDGLEGDDRVNCPSSRYPVTDRPKGVLRSIIISMRPHQWYKTSSCSSIIFSDNLLNLGLWAPLLLAFLVFCILSGSLYIINDVKDIDLDKLHPKKRYRPIAAGDLSPAIAVAHRHDPHHWGNCAGFCY